MAGGRSLMAEFLGGNPTLKGALPSRQQTLDITQKRPFPVGVKRKSRRPNHARENRGENWVRSTLQVLLTSSAGEKRLTYNSGTGINGHTGNSVDIYLGTTGSTSWRRFERNIEADYELYAGGATWTNTDGLIIIPDATYGSYDMNVDDIRLSNSLTSEHNTLGPGSIAHILRHRKINPTTHAVTDRWFHYDQVGSVMNESNAAGTLETTHHQDAFGNVQMTWDTGLWDAGRVLPDSASDSAIDSFTNLQGEHYRSTELGDVISSLGVLGTASSHPKGIAHLLSETVPPYAHDPFVMAFAAACALSGSIQAGEMSEYSKLLDRINGTLRDQDYYHSMDNALRHCIWNCCMVEAGLSLGQAKEIADWYETGDNFHPIDTPIDLHNNEISRQLGSSLTPPGGCDDDPCSEKCLRAWNGGDGMLR